ncbi:DUF1934 domain-containing protein [Paenibacillus psychroresistens]|nr:DUF1934 domain-containing protein [Paenibacillus psychroresistens]
MMEKRNVKLQIASQSDGQMIEQTFNAELYVKGDHSYYRYNETDENMGRTITTLKVEPGQIRIIRHGDVQSEQSFALQSHRSFSYQTPQGRLELTTFTHAINVGLVEQIGTISWSYDLFVSDELSGTYSLIVEISELD